jgi:predicted PhzF superfamily epimerase YddE/YHI9
VPVPGLTVHILSKQGTEIGQPSTLYVEVDHTGEEIAAVRMGGQVVLVAEGVVRF